jgi:hypothetical protein
VGILRLFLGLTLVAAGGAMIYVGLSGAKFDLLDQFAIVVCLASGLGLLWAEILSRRENRLEGQLHRRKIEPS